MEQFYPVTYVCKGCDHKHKLTNGEVKFLQEQDKITALQNAGVIEYQCEGCKRDDLHLQEDEWAKLMAEAMRQGLSPEEIRYALKKPAIPMQAQQKSRKLARMLQLLGYQAESVSRIDMQEVDDALLNAHQPYSAELVVLYMKELPRKGRIMQYVGINP
jgi:hypothetical protein